MKETKITTICELINELNKEKQEETTKLIDECMKLICCESVEWQNFQVFQPSCKMMKEILNAQMPEYLMTIADKLNQEKNPNRIVKIGIVQTRKETSINTINQNADITLAYISLSEKRRKEIEERAKE